MDQSQLDHFCSHGFVRMEGMFRGAELKALREAASIVVDDGVHGIGPHDSLSSFLRRLRPSLPVRHDPRLDSAYWRTKRLWSYRTPVGDRFAAAVVHPDLLQAVGVCIGRPFLPVNDYLITKLPSSGFPIHWHQDPPYNDPRVTTTEPVPNLDASIYLDDATVANGCVWVLPDHHLVGHVAYESRTERELFEDSGAIPVEMKAGDVLLHSLSAPHGSAGNRAESCRRVYYVHYMTQEVCARILPGGPEGSQPGFTSAGRVVVADMVSTRIALGLPNPMESGVRLEDDGFRVVGKGNARVHRWVTNMHALSPDEVLRKKHLLERLSIG